MGRWTLALLLAGCADLTPIEDGAELGPVVVVQDWFTSVAALPHDDGVVLFDAGFRSGRMETALDGLGFTPADVTDVVLTHGHGDHIGALGLFPGARVHALEAEVDLVAEETPGPVVTDTLVDGQTLSFPPHTVEVFAMPGHTSGSAAFLVGGVVLLGDNALITGDGSLEPVAERRSEDPDGAVAALEVLADRLEPRADSVTHLLPSRSGAADGLQPLLDFRDR
jgi:glyoxylase-like metal-dependent hydrolase (beta-lactamase superfamily II)